MKTRAYFDKKIEALKNELYEAIHELASVYQNTHEKYFIYPQEEEEISFYNSSTDTFENHKIGEVLVDKKGICIYPKLDDYCPYALSDIINIHDILSLRSIFENENLRNKLCREVADLAATCRGKEVQYLIYPQENEKEIQFLNSASEKFEPCKIKNILIGETWVYVYPVSSAFCSYNLPQIRNSDDLMIVKSLITREMNRSI